MDLKKVTEATARVREMIRGMKTLADLARTMTEAEKQEVQRRTEPDLKAAEEYINELFPEGL